MNVNEIYLDCADLINSEENGELTVSMFNRFSWIGQLKMMDWLSGDISGVQPPQPYLTQKNKDWLADFITRHEGNVVSGKMTKPSDYYQWDNGFIMAGKFESDCEDDESEEVGQDGCSIPIEFMDGVKFNIRCRTHIYELKPSYKKPICKMVGKEFHFLPTDIGNVVLEYIRYPKRAVLKTKLDPAFNDQVYDSATSEDFEWPEFSRNILVWFIVDSFANRTREQALKQFNSLTGKTPREGK